MLTALSLPAAIRLRSLAVGIGVVFAVQDANNYRQLPANFRCSIVKGAFVSSSSIKDDALRLVQQLPANATWEDLQYEIYVRQAIDAGLKDSREGRTVPANEVRRQFGLDSQ